MFYFLKLDRHIKIFLNYGVLELNFHKTSGNVVTLSSTATITFSSLGVVSNLDSMESCPIHVQTVLPKE